MMRFIKRFLGCLLLLLACISLWNIPMQKSHVSADEEMLKEYYADLSQTTCSEFAKFTTKEEDTHRTRIIVQKDAPFWGEISLNDHPHETESKLLKNIMVNEKSVYEHRVEYIEQWLRDEEPEIISNDYYFVKDLENSCPIYRPINVILYYDVTIPANVIDIYIPESYISTMKLESVGFIGEGKVLNDNSPGEHFIYHIKGDVTIYNPQLPPPKPKYTVTINGAEQKLEEDSLIPKPSYEPKKEETVSHIYEFIGWYYEENGEKKRWDFEKDTLKGDLTLTAEFLAVEKEKFTVTFDGVESYAYIGSFLQKPEDPVGPSTAEYTYTFDGWFYNKDGVNVLWDFESNTVTENVALSSKFTCSKARYYVYAYVEKGLEECFIIELEWGEEIPYPILKAEEGHEVAYWIDENGETSPEVMPTKDLHVYPCWKLAEYTLFVFCNKEILWKSTYTIETEEAALSELKGCLSALNTSAYTYMWKERLPNKLPYVDGSIFYVERSAIRYTITFQGAVGVTPISFTVETIEGIQLPPVPYREGYVGKWDKSVSDIKLENTIITAVYTKVSLEEDLNEEIYISDSNGGCASVMIGKGSALILLSILFFLSVKIKEKCL